MSTQRQLRSCQMLGEASAQKKAPEAARAATDRAAAVRAAAKVKADAYADAKGCTWS